MSYSNNSFFISSYTPHFMWLIDNEFKTIFYGLNRTSVADSNFLNHLLHPLKFILKQIVILIPFFVLLSLIISKFKFKFKFNDEKLVYLMSVTLLPILFMLLTSLILRSKY